MQEGERRVVEEGRESAGWWKEEGTMKNEERSMEGRRCFLVNLSM